MGREQSAVMLAMLAAAGVLGGALPCLRGGQANAQSDQEGDRGFRSSSPVTVNSGSAWSADQDPLTRATAVAKTGTVCVPVRALLEWLGGTVAHDEGAIVAARDARTVTLAVGERSASINGRKSELPVAPFTVNAVCYVPLRFVAEAFGAQVAYDPKARAVTVAHAGRSSFMEVASPPLPGFLDPFPTAIAGLRGNPKAMATVRALIRGANAGEPGDGGLRFELYGSQREGNWGESSGWIVESAAEMGGPYVHVWVEDVLHGNQWQTILRRGGNGYRDILPIAYEVPPVQDVRSAGISPRAWEAYFLPTLGYWPQDESGGREARQW